MKDRKTVSYLKTKDAICFDMDGTLFNTEPLHAEAIKRVLLEEFNLDFNASELQARYYGHTDADVFREVIGQHCDANFLTEKKNSFLKEVLISLSKEELLDLQTPGMIDLLNELKLSGKKMALISASENEIVELIVLKAELDKYFPVIVGRSDTPKSKPHPDPYLLAMKKLDTDATNTLIFEDSPTGIKSALASGAEVIVIDPSIRENDTTNSIANFLWLKE